MASLKIVTIPDVYGLNRTPDQRHREYLIKSCRISFARVFKVETRDVVVAFGKGARAMQEKALAELQSRKIGKGRGSGCSRERKVEVGNEGEMDRLRSEMKMMGLDDATEDEPQAEDLNVEVICLVAPVNAILPHLSSLSYPTHRPAPLFSHSKAPPRPSTPAQAITPRGVFPFLALPYELRCEIYQHLLPPFSLSLDRLPSTPEKAASQIAYQQSSVRALMLVSQQIRSEIQAAVRDSLPRHQYILAPWSMEAVFTTNSNNNPSGLTVAIEMHDLGAKAALFRVVRRLTLVFNQEHLRNKRFVKHAGALAYMTQLASFARVEELTLRIPAATIATVDPGKLREEEVVPPILECMRANWRGLKALEITPFTTDKRVMGRGMEEKIETIWKFLWEEMKKPREA